MVEYLALYNLCLVPNISSSNSFNISISFSIFIILTTKARGRLNVLKCSEFRLHGNNKKISMVRPKPEYITIN